MSSLVCSGIAFAESVAENIDGSISFRNVFDRVLARDFPTRVNRGAGALVTILWGKPDERSSCTLRVRHESCDDREFSDFGKSGAEKEIHVIELATLDFPKPGVYVFDLMSVDTLLARACLMVQGHAQHEGRG